MKIQQMIVRLAALLIASSTGARPGGTYTLTGNEKNISEIVIADMEKFPELYKGETLNGYISKFKAENNIGKRKLSPGDQLRFPATLSSIKAEKTKVEKKVRKNTRSEEPPGSISNVKSRKTTWKTKRRGSYKAQTFEFNFTIVSGYKTFRSKSYFEFEDKKGNIHFLSTIFYNPNPQSTGYSSSSCLYIDADENNLDNVKLKGYCIQIFLTDESGKTHLEAEICEGCESLEELKGRNEKPIGV